MGRDLRMKEGFKNCSVRKLYQRYTTGFVGGPLKEKKTGEIEISSREKNTFRREK